LWYGEIASDAAAKDGAPLALVFDIEQTKIAICAFFPALKSIGFQGRLEVDSSHNDE
jgi:hypothetical protein